MLQSFPRLLSSDFTPRTQLSDFTAEATLLAGSTIQCVVPSLIFDGVGATQKRLRYEAWGYIQTTGTPTYTFYVRLGTTAANDITGTIIGQSAAITTTSGVSEGSVWHLSLDIVASTLGQGSNGLTLASMGWINGPFAAGNSGMGISSPTTTWTAASWNSLLTYYISLSAACGAASVSNKIKLMSQMLWELN